MHSMVLFMFFASSLS